MNKRKVSLLVYDFDGTLVDTLLDISNAVNLVLEELGLRTLSRDTIRKYVGKGVERLMAQSIDGTNYADLPCAVELFRKHYSKNLMNHTRFYPSGREILDHFHDKKQAICSNKPEDFVRRILQSLDSTECFDAILGGDSLKSRKPDPEGLLHLLDRFQCSPEQAVMIGDSPVDIETGKRAGVYTCVVRFGFGDSKEIDAAGPDCSIDHLTELKHLFY
ncbi:MAG: HAD-IA family hydrolase [Nitrospinaceae bacterium]|mgnify:FL=1|nr:HAD-IA family hydrolase [Nitrospina sp.]MBT5377404.1 HAD-IA family hydrolase [Nitrospinaceae bacterium]MBT5869565.1 HAD-IA family hydrolase [Nitrospinaceae bacterium]MBT6345731.1 HAD-IA family hydrolase [Nitrospina sp.]